MMLEFDAVNDHWDGGVLKVASRKIGAATQAYGMKQDGKSPNYTTSRDGTPVAKA